MNGVFYCCRDDAVLDSACDFISHRRCIEPSHSLEFIYVILSGDAGTGKTWQQDGLKECSSVHPMFTGSTNVAGQVLKKVFSNNQMYVKNHTVHTTIFKQTLINPKQWGKCLKILFEGIPKDFATGSVKTPHEFYTAFSKNLSNVSRELASLQTKYNPGMLTPEEYLKYRMYTENTTDSFKTRQDKGSQQYIRDLHFQTIKHLSGVYARCNIPDQLVFDTEVIDEAGRLQFCWLMVRLGLWFYINNLFNTGLIKPVFVAVGSCTQSKVINNSCQEGCEEGFTACFHPKIKLNDYNLISAISNPALYFESEIFSKQNKQNRRVKTGDIEKSANLAMFRNCLEMNQPIPESVMTYIKSNMSVTEEEFYTARCVHLCLTHNECSKVQDRDIVDPSDVLKLEENMISVGVDWSPKLYYCSSQAGAMFKSANYSESNEWLKTEIAGDKLCVRTKLLYNIKPGVSEDGATATDFRKFSQWSATRKFYKGRPYQTTHITSGSLIHISGSCKDFLKDIEEQSHMFEDNFFLYKAFVDALGLCLMQAFPTQRQKCLDIIEKNADNGTIDDLFSCIQGLKKTMDCLLQSQTITPQDPEDLCMDMDTGEYVAPHQQAHVQEDVLIGPGDLHVSHQCESGSTQPRILVPKGETVYIDDTLGGWSKSPLKVRVGRTLIILMHRTCIKVHQTPDKYQKTPFVRKQKDRNESKKTAPDDNTESVGSINDLSEEEKMSVLHQSLEITEMKLNEEDFNIGLSDPADKFTVLEIYPLKLNLSSTVAASQGMTINSSVYGQINNNIDAYSLIVMSTRSSSADNIKFYFTSDNPSIIPLDNLTLATIQKLFLLSNNTTGYL